MSIVKLIFGRPKGSVYFIGSYREDGKELFLVDHGKRVTQSLMTNDKTFSRTVSPGQELQFEISDSQSGQDVLRFLKNHPIIKTEGYTNPNYNNTQDGKPFLILEIPHEKEKLVFSSLQEKLFVVDKIRQLSESDMFDLTYALAGDPRGKTPTQLYNDLVGEDLAGLATRKPKVTIAIFKLNRVEKEARIYAEKAIHMGVVSFESGLYKVADTILGKTKEDVATSFITNVKLFNEYVKKEVDSKEAEGRVLRAEKVFDPNDLPEDLRDLLGATTVENKAVKEIKGQVPKGKIKGTDPDPEPVAEN